MYNSTLFQIYRMECIAFTVPDRFLTQCLSRRSGILCLNKSLLFCRGEVWVYFLPIVYCVTERTGYTLFSLFCS